MKKFFIGFIAGGLLTCFLMISMFEIVHIEIEKIPGMTVCGYFFDATGKIFGENLQHAIKITYKIFAKPIKTILINGVAENTLIIKY